jgi:hypothetical protein
MRYPQPAATIAKTVANIIEENGAVGLPKVQEFLRATAMSENGQTEPMAALIIRA